MAGKDIAEKNLEEWNDVFADIVNVLLFNGKRLVKEDELESDTKSSQFKADGKIHEQERDVSKFWKHGEIRISILGFENQTRQDYYMPLRIISYDGASYKQELLDKSQKHKYPVATLVLYFGTDEHWTAPKNLCDCFDIPDDLKPFISDYKINVFEIAWLDDETIEKFTSDFKILAKYFQTKRLRNDYEGSKDEIKHVDSLLKMMSTLTGDNSFEVVYNESNLQAKGGITMCEVVERIINRGITQGLTQGRAEGLSQGLTQGRAEGRAEGEANIIVKMLDAKALTAEQIADILKISVAEVQSLAKKAPAQD